jgi:hypothetical protein
MERGGNPSCRKLKPSEVEGKQRHRSNDCPVPNGQRTKWWPLVTQGEKSPVPPSLSLCHYINILTITLYLYAPRQAQDWLFGRQDASATQRRPLVSSSGQKVIFH